MRNAKITLYLVACVALLCVGALALRVIDAIDKLEPQAQETLRGLHASANEIALTMKNVRAASADSAKLTAASLAVEKQAKKDLEHFDRVISRTDVQVNGQILPNLASAVAAQNMQLTETQEQLRETLAQFSRDSQATLTQTQTLLANVSTVAADPSIKQSFANIEQSTRNAAQLTSEASATMADVKTGVHYELEQLMKPVSKIKAAAEFAVRLAGRFLGY